MNDLITRAGRASLTFTNLGEVETADLLDELINEIDSLRNRLDQSEAWHRFHDVLHQKQTRKHR